MEILEKIKLDNRKRQKKYYDINKINILNKRKAIKEGIEPKPKIEIKYVNQAPPDIIIKLKNDIELLKNEIQKLKIDTPKEQPEIINYNYSYDELINIINEKILNQTSKKTYINNSKTIYEILDTTNIYKSLKNYKNVIYKLKTISLKNDNKIYSVNSLKLFFQTILKIISLYNLKLSKNATEEYKKEFELLKITSNINNEEINKEVLNFNDYINLIKEKFGVLSKEYIIILFYKIHTFRNNLKNLLIIDKLPEEENKNINYLLIPKDNKKNVSFYLNNYKTKDKYGQNIININKLDSQEIRNYIKKNNIEYNNYLFKNNISSFIRKFNKNINLDITINTLRKMKISTELKDNEKNPNIILKTANDAGHTSTTQQKIYLKTLKKNI